MYSSLLIKASALPAAALAALISSSDGGGANASASLEPAPPIIAPNFDPFLISNPSAAGAAFLASPTLAAALASSSTALSLALAAARA